jgi:Zn finger protein HypA/HybF involved in hydrogenase expression
MIDFDPAKLAKDLTNLSVKTTTIDESNYADATENYRGWCIDCKEFTRDNTEPDAENYDCPQCLQRNVVGAEQAMLLGLIEF